MNFDIKPNDRFLQSERTIYRTNVPHEEVTDAMVIRRCKHDNLSPGDEVIVQCMDHEKTRLLHEIEYRIIERTDMPASEENERGDIRQFTKTTFTVERMREWASGFGKERDAKLKADAKQPRDQKAA